LLSWFRNHSFEGAPPATHVIIMGVSQTGRLIRQMLYDGMNVDANERLVFDGALSIVAGAGRGRFNHRFGLPTRAASLLEDRDYPTDLSPFTSSAVPGPGAGHERSLLHRAADARGRVPKLFLINNTSEFWNRAASLIATDAAGRRDIPPDDSTRHYLLSGTQHFQGFDTTRKTTVNCVNPIDRMPTMRALLIAMQRWVRDGVLPPEGAYPSLVERTLVTVEQYQRRFPSGIGLTAGPSIAFRDRFNRLPATSRSGSQPRTQDLRCKPATLCGRTWNHGRERLPAPRSRIERCWMRTCSA
jgi:Alpha/beta hydrolase domain